MLQTRAIEPGTLELLRQLMSLPTIEPFYLVGGTALALQLGHRLSVTQRGSKKDFFDIFFLLEKMSLEDMLQLFQEKFKMYETFHVVKSLTYFEDAEQYADPIVFDPTVSWTQVKSSVKKAVSKLIGL